MSRLTDVLRQLNAIPAIGDFLKELDKRVHTIEHSDQGIAKFKEAVKDGFAKMETAFNERLEQLEEMIEGLVETAGDAALMKRMDELENLIMLEADKFAKGQEVIEAGRNAPKEAKPQKITVFGCLPRQFENLKKALPHLEIIHMQRASKAKTHLVFVCSALVKKAGRNNFKQMNPDADVTWMEGAQSGWIQDILKKTS